jgi:hypothetical protein
MIAKSNQLVEEYIATAESLSEQVNPTTIMRFIALSAHRSRRLPIGGFFFTLLA